MSSGSKGGQNWEHTHLSEVSLIILQLLQRTSDLTTAFKRGHQPQEMTAWSCSVSAPVSVISVLRLPAHMVGITAAQIQFHIPAFPSARPFHKQPNHSRIQHKCGWRAHISERTCAVITLVFADYRHKQ